MKINKRIMLLPIVCLMCGCNSSNPFGSYSYTNKQPIDANYKSFTNADNMIIDGVKESQYGEKIHRLYLNNDTSSRVYMDTYIYFGKEGMHCFVEVKDNIVAFNRHRKVYYNSSIELFFNDITKTRISNDTLQFRIAAGGSFTKLCGVSSASKYASSYFDGEFATKVLGEINTTDCEGFNVEVFIPWYELGFNSVDEVTGLMVNPVYNRFPSVTESQTATFRNRITKRLAFQATPHSWVPVEKTDDNSGVNITPEGEFFGKNDEYYPSYGFDLTNDKSDGTGVVNLNSTSAASSAFIKNYTGTNYYFESFVDSISGKSSDNPKIGLTTFLARNRITLYLKNNDKNRFGVVQRNTANSAWNWTTERFGAYSNESFAIEGADYIKNGAKLAIYRKDGLLCFFVNDILCFSNYEEIVIDESVIKPMQFVEFHSFDALDENADASMIGIYSYSAKARFSNYKLLTDNEANEKFNSLVK